MSAAATVPFTAHLPMDEGAPDGVPYLLIDAARDEAIYPALRDFGATEVIVPLYQGDAAADLAAVAPYLVKLGADSPVFDWIWEEGWNLEWGCFAWWKGSTRDLRTHLRRLTKVRTEDGTVLLFRFYDPGVLASFLPTCDSGQLDHVFGQITALGVPLPGEPSMELFRYENKSLVRARLPLA